MYPAYLGIFITAALLTVPFYFFNKFLVRSIRPKQNGKRLLGYFIVVAVSAFIYITAGIYLIVWVAKWINTA